MVCFPIREDIGTVLSALSYEGLARRSIFLALPIYQNWSSFKTHRTFFQTCSSRLLYFSKYPETQLLPKLDSNRERTARRCLSFWSCVLLKIERLLFSASTCLLNLLYGIAICFHLGIEVSISVLILILESRTSSSSLSSLEDPSLSVKASVQWSYGCFFRTSGEILRQSAIICRCKGPSRRIENPRFHCAFVQNIFLDATNGYDFSIGRIRVWILPMYSDRAGVSSIVREVLFRVYFGVPLSKLTFRFIGKQQGQ